MPKGLFSSAACARSLSTAILVSSKPPSGRSMPTSSVRRRGKIFPASRTGTARLFSWSMCSRAGLSSSTKAREKCGWRPVHASTSRPGYAIASSVTAQTLKCSKSSCRAISARSCWPRWRLDLTGLTVLEHEPLRAEFESRMRGWISRNALVIHSTRFQGLKALPQVFSRLLKGDTLGRTSVGIE